MLYRRILLASLVLLTSHSLLASDARKTALGGAGVTSGEGVSGVNNNPALLLSPQLQGKATHFRFGAHGVINDSGEIIDELVDSADLITDLESEINTLNARSLTCNPLVAVDDTVCLDNTEAMGLLVSDVVNLFNKADETPLAFQMRGDLGMAFTQTAMPFAINLGSRGTVINLADVSDGDFSYANTLNAALADGDLTFREIQDTANINISPTGDSVDIDLPDDVLDSSTELGVITRGEVAISFAKSLALTNNVLNLGATVRIASITATDLTESIQDFDTDKDYDDTLDANEVSETAVNLDLGMTTTLPSKPNVTLGAAVYNLIKEEIETNTGYQFETTPQLVVSGRMDADRYMLTADLALNKAKVDNLESQILGFGAETRFSWLAVRGGLSHDLAAEESGTAATFGLGLGPVDLGARFSRGRTEMGAQLAFSF